jgi:hypothetical protein
VTHIPHYAAISDIHMLSEDAVLSSSIQYGIVARSFPLTGKVVKGYLNASGMHHGLGAGNPNAEFAPDVTACVVSSDGASARILWGRRDGSVAVMWHPRTMSGSRAAAKICSSRVEDEHRGAVAAAAFAADGSACVSAGVDGVVKIWSLKRFGAVWTSSRAPVPEPLTMILEDLAHGILACTTAAGVIVVHLGFDLVALNTPGAPQFAIATHRFVLPTDSTDQVSPTIEQLFLRPHLHARPGFVELLVRANGWSAFYRLRIDVRTGASQLTAFGDPAAGAVSVVSPIFGADAAETSFVLAGDMTGGIAVYDWDALPPALNKDAGQARAGKEISLIGPCRRTDVFPDASITALAMHAFVLAVGSARGAVRVLDALTLEPLRAFAAPIDAPVRRILLGRSMLLAAVGSRVLAWKGGAVADGRGRAGKGKARARGDVDKKWQSASCLLRPTSSHFLMPVQSNTNCSVTSPSRAMTSTRRPTLCACDSAKSARRRVNWAPLGFRSVKQSSTCSC